MANSDGKRQTIIILGKPYSLIQTKELKEHNLMGQARRAQQKIAISPDLGKDQYDDTLLHEILHVINDELQLGLPEETIGRLAVGLHSAGYRRKSR